MRMSWIKKPALLQAEAGLAALMLGILVYVATRSGQQVFFLRYLPTSHSDSYGGIGDMLYALPSMLHIYAFILLTAAVVSSNAHQLRLICTFWLVTEVMFEIGQQHDVAVAIVEHLPAWFYGSAVLETVPNYFLRGTFDPLDIIGLLLGTLAAYATAMSSNGRSAVD
jgi:hypothetical protein